LHGSKVATREIGKITFLKRKGLTHHDCPPTAVLLKDGKEVPFPSCPPPAYISGFKEIQIK
jgi:hypothetical protein